MTIYRCTTTCYVFVEVDDPKTAEAMAEVNVRMAGFNNPRVTKVELPYPEDEEKGPPVYLLKDNAAYLTHPRAACGNEEVTADVPTVVEVLNG